MELEGTLDFEQPRTPRWILIAGVIAPVVVCVVVAAWFVRSFIAPPMIAIPSAATLAAASSTVQTARRPELPVAAPQLPDVATAPTASVVTNRAAVQAPAMSTLAALATFPPPPPPAAIASPFPTPTAPPVTTAYAAPTQEDHAAAIEPGEPISGPIPLPLPRRPNLTVAHAMIGAVPLPRPRPVEATPATAPDVQTFDRHSVH